MVRYNTSLESSGAEHLVIGRLLIDRIQAFRAHANQPGYDLLAVDPSTHRALKIQVKSRVGIDSGKWAIKNFDFDFVVLVRLNRGTKASLNTGSPEETRHPEFYVVPQSAIEGSIDENGTVRIAPRDVVKYLDGWTAIRSSLVEAP